jgi:RNA-binding protein
MERIGTVERTAQGLAIVRAEDPPDIGHAVVDESLNAVGRVVDVFGPVESPFAAVTPEDDRRLPELLGERLYVR